jgi:hypothetical protein
MHYVERFQNTVNNMFNSQRRERFTFILI